MQHDRFCLANYDEGDVCDCTFIKRVRDDEALDMERLLMKKIRSDMMRYLSEYGSVTQVPVDYIIRFFDER